jgi:hypothetical protein
MINEKVVHKVFGDGVIIAVRDSLKPFQKYITVEFVSGQKTFLFPDAFENFLTTSSTYLIDEVEKAFEGIDEIQEQERKARKIEEAKKELELAQAELDFLLKKETKKSSVIIGDKLVRGSVCGTAAKKIYEACCEKLVWNKSEVKCFGWQTPNYSDVATSEGYSVWFLSHNNWTGTYTGIVKNRISESYMEQWWMDSIHPKATTRKRVIFAKNNVNKYVFLGVFMFDACEKVIEEDGMTYYVERFNCISEQYPEA